MERIIKHRLFYAHRPEVVWQYLTHAALLEQWLMKNDFLPIVGHEFHFMLRPMPDYNFDGIVHCTVLELLPYKRLRYSWKCGPGQGKITVDSVVQWELVEKENGTELLLEHTGFELTDRLSLFDIMEPGWLKNMNKIAELINAERHASTQP